MKRAADDAIDSGVDNRPLPISAIVLTYNEEQNIEACLRSLEGVVDEILVVDSGSMDRTLEIARRFTHNIFTHPFEDYAQQRNWCQAALPIRNEWIFHIDADERVTTELVLALRSFFGTPPPATVSGLAVRRRIEFMGRAIVHGGIYPTYHSRIYRLESGRCEAREYDQQFLVDGTLVMLDADLIEHTAQSLFTWTARHNRWAQMEAKHLLAHSESLPAGETIQPKLIDTGECAVFDLSGGEITELVAVDQLGRFVKHGIKPTEGRPLIKAIRTMAVVVVNGEIHAFSALTGTWATLRSDGDRPLDTAG